MYAQVKEGEPMGKGKLVHRNPSHLSADEKGEKAMEKRTLNRRDFLRLTAAAATGAVMAACAPAAPQVVEKVVVQTVEIEKVVEKEVVVEKPRKPGEAVSIQIIWRTTPSEVTALNEIIAKFEEKHPDISVATIITGDFDHKLLTMVAGGIAPDIVGPVGGRVADRYGRGMLMSLEPYLDAEPSELKEDLFPFGVDTYTIQGELIGLPYSIYWPGVFYNATLFDEAGVDYPPVDWKGSGWTWNDMIETTKKLTLDKNGDGKIDQYGLNCGHAQPWTYTRLWGADIISDEDYASGILTGWQTDDPKVYNALVNSLQARADAIHKHKVTPTPATASGLSQMGPMLKTGVVAIDYTGTWAIRPPLPEKFKFGAGANPLGGENGEGTRGKFAWVDPWQITDQSENPDAAWEFIKYMTWDPEALKIRVTYVPCLPSVMAGFPMWMDTYAPTLRAMSRADVEKTVLGGLEDATRSVPCHILIGWGPVREIFVAELDPVWKGDKTAEEAVDTMLPLIEEAIQKHLEESGLG